MAKNIALASGALLVVLGMLGFFPNPVVGVDGLFKINQIHDVAHIAFGLILLGVATLDPRTASPWLKVLGAIYILRALLGFFVVPFGGNLFDALATNAPDHILHLVFGIVLLGSGYLENRPTRLST